MRTIKTITGISLLILMGFTAPKNPADFKISLLDEPTDEYVDRYKTTMAFLKSGKRPRVWFGIGEFDRGVYTG